MRAAITKARNTACAAEHAGEYPPEQAVVIRNNAIKAQRELDKMLDKIKLDISHIG
ncbi:MAG: hypothetical protein ACK5LG_21790 [Bacteroides thetaiotaomicron]